MRPDPLEGTYGSIHARAASSFATRPCNVINAAVSIGSSALLGFAVSATAIARRSCSRAGVKCLVSAIAGVSIEVEAAASVDLLVGAFLGLVTGKFGSAPSSMRDGRLAVSSLSRCMRSRVSRVMDPKPQRGIDEVVLSIL